MNTTLWCGCLLRLLGIVSQMFLTSKEKFLQPVNQQITVFRFYKKKGTHHFELSKQIFKCFDLVCTYKKSISCL